MISSFKPLAGKIRRRKGIALITVVTMLALATVLVLALFSTTQTELQSTTANSEGAMARQRADMAVNLVIGQLRKASMQDSAIAGREIWTSQPGVARQYRESGRLATAFKLYSSNRMSVTATADTDGAEATALAALSGDTPDVAWDDASNVNSSVKRAQWVDMNEPVIREGSASGTRKIIFPIIDPRAFVTGGNNPQKTAARARSVEGFSYTTYANGTSGGVISGVKLSQSETAADDSQRLPMPVKWIYVLQDGTLGTLADTGVFAGADGEVPTAINPIVSRIAFWTDDESSKININTAGEGTPWETPRFFSQWDGDWARFQPMMYEYQRYPGHPSSVAMSTVLFPYEIMNPTRTAGSSDTSVAAFNSARDKKEIIYDLMPKILRGGSQSGSIPVPLGRNFTPTQFSNVTDALKERLFASVDEFLLKSAVTTNSERQEIDLGVSALWAGVSKPEVVERLRFFMTTNSKAPDANPFGMPKIAMWPVYGDGSEADEAATAQPGFRSVFDRMIAQSSTIGGKGYFFQRNKCNSPDEIADSLRNQELMTYLKNMTDKPIPGFGASGATFALKYGTNRDQILVEIFDYIRSTNLYDDNLVEQTLGMSPPDPTGAPGGRNTAYTAAGGLKAHTFTPMRSNKSTGDVGAVSMSSWPGHGQVVPSAYGSNSRGMGRFATISEAALHVICCAVGSNQAGGGWALKKSVASGDFTAPAAASGYVPTNVNAPPYDSTGKWYSNFPPLNAGRNDYTKTYAQGGGLYNANPLYPAGTEKIDVGGALVGGDQVNYPGYKPIYWNWTLDYNTPLAINVKRCQATMIFEWFIPGAGWTIINPDFRIEVDVSQLNINGQQLFSKSNSNNKIVIKPWAEMNSLYEIYRRGGTTSYRGFLQGRALPNVKSMTTGNPAAMPADASYTGSQYTGTDIANGHRYDLVSDFFDVTGGTFSFSGGNVKVEIYQTAGTTPLQTINIPFKAAEIPTPNLVTDTGPPKATLRTDGGYDITYQVPPPYWWAFNADGAMGRNANGIGRDPSGGAEMGGRVLNVSRPTNFGTGAGNGHGPGNFIVPEDTITSMVLKHGDPRLVLGQVVVGTGTMSPGGSANDEFVPHRNYGFTSNTQGRQAHNMVFANLGQSADSDIGISDTERKRFAFNSTVAYPNNWRPDVPYADPANTGVTGITAEKDFHRYGDFDRGIVNMEDGAYVNKPDEGNSTVTKYSTSDSTLTVPYFSNTWTSWTGGSTYFSPNRQVSSPVMFGSLPTGVQNSGSTPRQKEGWRTLLFRPQLYISDAVGSSSGPTKDERAHPGAPATLKWTDPATSPSRQKVNNIGGTNPPDYALLDFFNMPVVEPYAISDPGATSGRINMNYQILPFRHIRRATGMQAALKSEMIHSLPNADVGRYLTPPGSSPSASTPWFWKEDGNSDGSRVYWHRLIDADSTLALFDDRFKCGYAFISPAQICEMFLFPRKASNNDSLVPGNFIGTSLVPGWATTLSANQSLTSTSSISYFWAQNSATADNVKEKPYANIYPKLTTRSNTFQVYVRAQTLRKTRSTDVTKFVEGVDQVVGEYRGSTMVERYLDNDALLALPTNNQRDYATGSAGIMMNETVKKPLEAYHRFRILSQKTFD